MKSIFILVLILCLPFCCKANSNMVYNFTIKNGDTNIVFHYDLNQAEADKKREVEESRKRDEEMEKSKVAITNSDGEVCYQITIPLRFTVTNDFSKMKTLSTPADWERMELDYAARLFSIGLFEGAIESTMKAMQYSSGEEDTANLILLKRQISSARNELTQFLMKRLTQAETIKVQSEINLMIVSNKMIDLIKERSKGSNVIISAGNTIDGELQPGFTNYTPNATITRKDFNWFKYCHTVPQNIFIPAFVVALIAMFIVHITKQK